MKARNAAFTAAGYDVTSKVRRRARTFQLRRATMNDDSEPVILAFDRREVLPERTQEDEPTTGTPTAKT
jgi:hypothetical protein